MPRPFVLLGGLFYELEFCWRMWDKNHSLDNKFMTMIITMVKVKQMMIKITHLMIKDKMNKITPSKALPGQLKIPTIGEHSTFKDENESDDSCS